MRRWVGGGRWEVGEGVFRGCPNRQGTSGDNPLHRVTCKLALSRQELAGGGGGVAVGGEGGGGLIKCSFGSLKPREHNGNFRILTHEMEKKKKKKNKINRLQMWRLTHNRTISLSRHFIQRDGRHKRELQEKNKINIFLKKLKNK